MDGGWSQSAQVENMLLGAVTFMLSQSIAGVNPVKLHHHVVPGYLGHDRGTGNRQAEVIAINYSLLR